MIFLKSRKLTLLPLQILLVTVMNINQVRIVQGYFDGCLNIRCSRLVDFSNPDHEEVMDWVVQWLASKPRGETTIHRFLPPPPIDGFEFPENDKDDQQPQEALAIRSVA